MPSYADILKFAQLAMKVLDAVKAANGHLELPPDAQKELKHVYDLADYHGIAPADAPHIPDDNTI